MTNSSRSSPASKDQVQSASEDLDAWVREVVEWHFNPETGCPFWLEHAANLSWDPREEIQSFADLGKFDLFEDDWLRGGPVERWLPKGNAGKPVYIFETGGSTGLPKSRTSSEDFRLDYEIFSQTLSDETFPPGSDWISLGPTGPRRLRLAVEHLAQYRGGISFCLDMDPRWVVKCLKKGWIEGAQAYKDHVVDQALTILRAHPNVKCMFTTPKLLEALCEKINLAKAGITGIFCGGTEMDEAFHQKAREELVPGIDFVPTYGNTLMGLACNRPYVPGEGYAITYYAPQPRAVLQVVDPDNHSAVVEYGAVGRVKLTTLTKEFFVPGFLERDEANRSEPISAYPWDGVQDVRPFGSLEQNVVVGVY
ncbi:MAG: hypothetical protein VX288_09355 [Planctomycetota bacterium]|nr:hypothetical protein [Planctomycetota bacterium]